jgi:ADP-ribose pyrophosphatase
MRVDVKECRREYEGFFKLDRYVLRHERFDGTMSKALRRLVFERGDSVAVLLYDSVRDSVVLVEQFRLPAYLREEGSGRLLEVVAGTIETGRTPEETALSELVEEAGYALSALEPIYTFYTSPGACSERIYLYLGHLSSAVCLGSGGGRAESGEDIRVHEMPLAEALRLVQEGVIRDAKTLIALQYLALSRERHSLERSERQGLERSERKSH